MTNFIDTRNGHAHAYRAKDSFFGALFFGPLYWLYKGMFAWFFIACLLNLFTVGIAWMFIAPFAPMIRRNHLLNQGFIEQKQNKKYNKRIIATTQRIEPCL